MMTRKPSRQVFIMSSYGPPIKIGGGRKSRLFLSQNSKKLLKTPNLDKKILRKRGRRGVLPARPHGRTNFIPKRPWPTQ
jgi:hypothetical protein